MILLEMSSVNSRKKIQKVPIGFICSQSDLASEAQTTTFQFFLKPCIIIIIFMKKLVLL